MQGGTFLNDAVLRSFEREIGREVIRPGIAGLMGAYGAALYARSLGLEKSSTLSAEGVAAFTHTSKAATCHGCGNNCHLIINTFAGGRKVHLRQQVRTRCRRKTARGRRYRPRPAPLQARKDRGAGGIRPRRRTRHSRSAAGTGYVRAGAAVVHLLHRAWLPGDLLRSFLAESVPARTVLHSVRHRLLSRQADARAYGGSDRARRGRDLLPLPDLQHGRTHRGQSLQLPRGCLLLRTAGRQHGLVAGCQFPVPLPQYQRQQAAGEGAVPPAEGSLRRLYAPADKPRRAGGTDCLRSLDGGHPARGGGSRRVGERAREPHHDPCRATVSHRPGDRARHRSAGDISRLCRRDRGQHHRTDSNPRLSMC